MKRRTVVILIFFVVAALVILATVKPLPSVAENGREAAASVKTLYCDSNVATVGLNGSCSDILQLNGAVIIIHETNFTGTASSISWTIGSNEWQGSVRNIGAINLTLTIVDIDGDRMMDLGDRIEVRRDGRTNVSLSLFFDIRFAGGQEANCTFTYQGKDTIATMVSFIDVGQGDSILIMTADGHTMLIDAGPPLAAGALLSYLNNRSVTVIDALVITHPDSDHLGGADDVLRAFTVLSIYHPGIAKNTSAYFSFIHAAQDEGCPIHTAADTHPGDLLTLSSSVTVEVLNIDPAAKDVNDASIVLEMRTPGKSFLFTGDISSEVEGRLIANHSFNLDVDVLKVGHHGSRYSTSNAFLQAASPETAVICVGDNTYGHPTNETLTRLSVHDVTVLRTDQIGTIDIAA